MTSRLRALAAIGRNTIPWILDSLGADTGPLTWGDQT